MTKPLIAVPIGDPAGVGPEIVVKTLVSDEAMNVADVIVIGDHQIIEQAIKITKVNLSVNIVNSPKEGKYQKGVLNLIDLNNIDMSKFAFGKVNGMCGKAAYEYIEKSIELAMNREVLAVATPPINKESLRAGNINFIGHTEIFGALTKTPDPLTLFQVHKLRVFRGGHLVPSEGIGFDAVRLVKPALRMVRPSMLSAIAPVSGLKRCSRSHL